MGDTTLIAFNKGELNTAQRILEESIQAFEELKNPEWTSISLNRLTYVFVNRASMKVPEKLMGEIWKSREKQTP
jgi:hypothetical protein